jgi:hypothetical protein
MHELAEGRIGEAEAFGGRLLAEPIDEDGAKGLILTLTGTDRVEEEVTQRGVVHGGPPGKCEEISQVNQGSGYGQRQDAASGEEHRPGATEKRSCLLRVLAWWSPDGKRAQDERAFDSGAAGRHCHPRHNRLLEKQLSR